jgi:hypothetical protein
MSKSKSRSTIKVKVSDFVSAMRGGALSRFLGVPKPVMVAWENRHLVGACNAEYRSVEEQRIDLCKKWGRLDEESKDYVFDTPESEAGFRQDYQVLCDQIVSLPGRPVRLADLRGDLSETDLEVLEDFLEE